VFDGHFGADPGNDLQCPPFRNFGDNFYTYQILIDLKVRDDMAVLTPFLYRSDR
jgi:hypothetical protein